MTDRATASGSSSITDAAQYYIEDVLNTTCRIVSRKIINILYLLVLPTEKSLFPVSIE